MLREAGKFSLAELISFLKRNYSRCRVRRCTLRSSACQKPSGRGPLEECSVELTERSARLLCTYLCDTSDLDSTGGIRHDRRQIVHRCPGSGICNIPCRNANFVQ